MDCTPTSNSLDLRGTYLPIFLNEGDTLHISLVFKDDEELPRDLSLSNIYLVINDIIVAGIGNGITIGGVGNNEVSISYNLIQGLGTHNYQIRIEEGDVDKAELYGKLTIKDI